MVVRVHPLGAQIYSQASRLKGYAVGSAPNAISRLQQHDLLASIQQIASGTQARETSTDDDCFCLLHNSMLHAHSPHRHTQASSGVCLADTFQR